jgi:hypothetical protein
MANAQTRVVLEFEAENAGPTAQAAREVSAALAELAALGGAGGGGSYPSIAGSFSPSPIASPSGGGFDSTGLPFGSRILSAAWRQRRRRGDFIWRFRRTRGNYKCDIGNH